MEPMGRPLRQRGKPQDFSKRTLSVCTSVSSSSLFSDGIPTTGARRLKDSGTAKEIFRQHYMPSWAPIPLPETCNRKVL